MHPNAMICEYFNDLIKIVKTHYVFRDQFDEEASWNIFRKSIVEDDGSEKEKIWQASYVTLQTLNRHSFFRRPRPISADNTSERIPMPNGHVKDRIAYISLPGCGGTDIQKANYARSGNMRIKALLQKNPIGAVIDLRKNYGGDYHPMLAALAPLLDEENFVGWANGKKEILFGATWKHKEGHERVNGYRCPYIPRLVGAANKSIPVAVIQGNDTCSSGELIALALKGHRLSRSFGQATDGRSSINSDFPAPFPEIFGGGLVILTTALMADRHGHVYGEKINPDIETKKPLLEATQWIWQQARLKLQ